MIEESVLNKDIVKGNTHSSREIKNLFDDNKLFDYAKPTTLIKYIVEKGSSANDIILDFFAGSGTTGDSVMQLNAEDRANRKFILVQLPELIDPKKNKAAYDFVKNELLVEDPTIFEITKERLIRAGKKIKVENIDRPSKSEKVKCEGFDGEHCISCKGEHTVKIEAKIALDLSDVDLGFKIFETRPIWEDYEFKAKKLDSQAKLFDESKLSDEDIQMLLTTWKTYDNISLTESLKRVDLEDYIGYYGNGRLYLMAK